MLVNSKVKITKKESCQRFETKSLKQGLDQVISLTITR